MRAALPLLSRRAAEKRLTLMTMQRARWQQLSACRDEGLALTGPARVVWLDAQRRVLAAELRQLLPPEVLQTGRTAPGPTAAVARDIPSDDPGTSDHGSNADQCKHTPSTPHAPVLGVLQAFNHQLVAALTPAAAGDATRAGQHCGPWRRV